MQEAAPSGFRKTSPLPGQMICSLGKNPYPDNKIISQKAITQKNATKEGMDDKRTSLTEAMRRYLKDGINIGIGGFANTRIPVASIHEIIRQGARNLQLSVPSHSICCELLAGAMILNSDHLSIRQIDLAWHENEIMSTAPLLQYLTSNRMVKLEEYANDGMSARFKARAMGVPFLPTADHADNATRLTNSGKMTVCPFTGENIYLVPACQPDLALIHVQAADMCGNSRIFGDHYTCPEMAQASINTIVTTEQVILNPSSQNYPNFTKIPSNVVDAVIDQPFGATPGACYTNYGLDMSDIQGFINICEDFRKTGNKEKLRAYYNKHIFDVENFDDFLDQKPYPILQKLCQQDDDRPVILD
jgi:glutaconate CoA-transferase subunit A